MNHILAFDMNTKRNEFILAERIFNDGNSSSSVKISNFSLHYVDSTPITKLSHWFMYAVGTTGAITVILVVTIFWRGYKKSLEKCERQSSYHEMEYTSRGENTAIDYDREGEFSDLNLQQISFIKEKSRQMFGSSQDLK